LHGYYAGGSVVHGNKVSRAATGVTPDTSKWHHLVFMRFDKGMKLYVDCKLIDSIYDNSVSDYGAKTTLRIGARFNNTTYYNGKIDEVRIYNRAISAEEVEALGNCKNANSNFLLQAEQDLKVYPNPTENSINISTVSENNMDFIKVYSMSGQLVYSNYNPTKAINVDLSGLSTGVYLVQVQIGDKILTQKVNRL